MNNKEKLLLMKPKHNLEYETKKKCIISELVEIIKDHYPNSDFDTLKLQTCFLNHVCNLVETGIKKSKSKKYKIDKKQVVLTALTSLIPSLNSPDMLDIISKNIEDLHDKNMIKAISETEYYGKKIIKFCSKFII